MPTASREVPMWMGQPCPHPDDARKEPTQNSSVVQGARLVVLGVEVCGRWSVETQSFLSSLARAKARSLKPLLRKRAEQALRLRWISLISCTVARAVAMSLLGLPGMRGADGKCPPFHVVERDIRHVGLDP